MKYELVCKNKDCKVRMEIERPIQEGPGENFCPDCGEKMGQDFSKIGIRIPEHMQAGSDAISPTAMQNQFNRSRPSGKRRTAWAVGGVKG